MNDLKKELGCVMEHLSSDKDVVSAAKIRAAAECSGKKKPSRLFKSSAAAAVLIMICGLTVSAANFGFLQRLLGGSAAVIENNIDDYRVDVCNVKIDNAEGVPYKFTLGDVVSDGYSLYANILIENIEVEEPGANKRAASYNDQFDHFNASPKSSGKRFRYTMWEIIDAGENSANTAILAYFNEKIEKGDVFEFVLEDNSRRNDILNHIDAAENDRALLADISFEIESDVRDLKKTYDVFQTITFKDRWGLSPDDAPDEGSLQSLDVYVETVGVSPFGFEIKGTEELSQPAQSNALFSYGNIRLICKNGDRINIEAKGGQSENNGKCRDVVYYGNFFKSGNGAHGIDVKEMDEIAAIDLNGLIIPIE